MSKQSSPIILVIEKANHEIADEFVLYCKNLREKLLINQLQEELNELQKTNRTHKRSKLIDRINIVLNTLCKKLSITSIVDFLKNPDIQQVVSMLQAQNLGLSTTQDGVEIDSGIIAIEVA